MQTRQAPRQVMSNVEVRGQRSLHRTIITTAAAFIALVALTVAFGSVPIAHAGNVTGYTSFGDLFLTGSPQTDEIVIEQLANGTIRVRGQNGTTVAGSSFADFYNFNGNLNIDLQDGNDRVVIGDLQNAMQVPGEVTMDLGDGADMADLVGLEVDGNVTIMAGNGYDYVSIHYSHLHQDLLLDLGDDSDYALIQATQIDGSAMIDAIGRQGGSDQDIVELYDVTISGDLEVWVGAGVDGVVLTAVTVTGTATLDTGDHRDHVAVEKMHASALEVSLGNGNDLMELWDSVIGRVSFNPGEGKDKLCQLGNTIEETVGADAFAETCK